MRPAISPLGGIMCCSRSRVTARLHAIVFRPMASGARAGVHADAL
jgi:hypothetical protein